MTMNAEYIAIYEKQLIARGDIIHVIRAIKARNQFIEPYLYEVNTCQRIDIDWYGSADEVIAKLPNTLAPTPAKRGRPKLGVTSKEVTLLPRHWQWLSKQRGGASTTLRRLVDQAINNMSAKEQLHMLQSQLYNLMTVMADEAGFEEASRALYRADNEAFQRAIQTWPDEIKQLLTEKFDTLFALSKEAHHG
ncbi:DUF2239 family protein [Aestuariibacter halophilus]|uniref:DUF2239 family protein n=1 Tax=Fluctibacter halophilus TaxID=226011 RepID=A0ABS8G3V5_9ALTE|nr:DUF2239 family protein [Aestuariibacter halophilus]MCC2615272.1 DUF2239 family protein [Aestuariibacter halophilus]